MAEPESESVSASAKLGDGMTKLGGRMVGLCFACLIVGRVVVSIFFPDSRGQGITPTMWFVLIPIWSIGIIGLALLLVGWIRGKTAEPPSRP